MMGRINRAYQSNWTDNFAITIINWTSSHGRGKRRQGGQIGRGMRINIV